MGQKHKGFLHTRRAETGYLLHTFNLLDAVLDSAAALNCAILIHSAVCPKTEAFCTTSCAGNSYFLHTRLLTFERETNGGLWDIEFGGDLSPAHPLFAEFQRPIAAEQSARPSDGQVLARF